MIADVRRRRKENDSLVCGVRLQAEYARLDSTCYWVPEIQRIRFSNLRITYRLGSKPV